MRRTLRMYAELWRVQTVNYFTDATNVVLGIVLTAVTMVCWVGFKPSVGGYSTDYFVFASACGVSIIRNSQYDLDLTVTDWRDKGLFKRLATTPVPNWLIWVAVLSFNWFINIAVSLFLFGLAMIFRDQRAILGNIQWGPFMVGFIMDIFLSQFMAFFLTILWKNRAVILVVSLLSYFLPMYLLGLGIPWSTVGNYAGLNGFLYCFPHRYVLALMQAGWGGTAIYHLHIAGNGIIGTAGFAGQDITVNMAFPIRDLSNMQSVDGVDPSSWLGIHGFGYGSHVSWSATGVVYDQATGTDRTVWHADQVTKGAGWWAPFLISLAWTIAFGFVTWLVVKNRLYFGQRQFKQYQGVQKHLHYISQIKKARNFDELDALMTYINASENRKQQKPRGRAKFRKDPEMRKAHLKRKELHDRYGE